MSTSPGKRACAIRHVAFEDAGSFTAVLAGHGYHLDYLETGVDDFAGLSEPPELLIVLGGPIAAYDEDLYPVIAHEVAAIERQIAADKPVLGVCLGAQLIARALGARVYPGSAKEIGWAPLSPSEAGERSCLAPLAQNDWQVLHWHGDTFDLPQGALRLASTSVAENQAFSLGPRILGLQFHVEAQSQALEQWLIGHAAEIAQANVDIPGLREDTKRWGAGLERAGASVLDAWLDEL
jgi:GMP synthase (glutamine-hydrolysing)